MGQRNTRRLVRIAVASALIGVGGVAHAQPTTGPTVVVIPLDGVVDPFIADHIVRQLGAAGVGDPGGERAFVIEIDTPGGYDSSMREITRAISNARVPVLCFVGPAGARAASAGAFILMSCPFAAMAPGTNVGAATPVGISGATLSAKAENDAAAYIRSLAERTGRDPGIAESFVTRAESITAEEALRAGMIDVIVGDRGALLDAADGRTLSTGSGGEVTLDLSGAGVEERGLGSLVGFLRTLIDPSVAFLFFWLGIVLLILEIVVPGHIFAGTLGAVLLTASLLSFGFFPVRLFGVVLLAGSAVFFLLELKVPGLGAWSVLGIVALILGGWFLIDRAGGGGVSPLAIVVVAGIVAGFFGFVVAKVLAMRHLPPAQGARAVVGKEGVVLGEGLTPDGIVRVAAEEWKAVSSAGPLPGGAKIKVTSLDGLVLTVEPHAEEHAPTGGAAPARGGNH